MFEGEKCVHDHDHGDPHRVRQRDRQSRSRMEIRFRHAMKASREFFSRQDRVFQVKTSSTSDRFTLAERFLFSVSMMLISFATFWMCFIFAIPAGLLLILRHLIILTAKFGRRIRKFVNSMTARSNDVQEHPGRDCAEK